MFDQSMKIKALPAELIITKFVKGDEDCNCEKYLREFVNKSTFFLQKSEGQQYHAPPSEANGEPDCISGTYTLDFKLTESETFFRAKSELSWGKEFRLPGILVTTVPKKQNDTQQVTRLHVALRGLDYNQLCQLRKNLPDATATGKDIPQFLKKLETKKHLLLFFPYYFQFDVPYEFPVGVAKIQEALNGDFRHAIEYRRQLAKGFDTYMAFLYSERIVFMEERDGIFFYVDCVELSESPIYMKLADYAKYF